MAFPFLAAAQVGSSILGSIFGNSAAKRQEKLSREQFAFQKQMAQEQLALAQEAARMGKATQVDAAGNVTMYDEATNTWKVILTPDQQQLLDAGEYEQYAQLTGDAAQSRSERTLAGVRRGQEGQAADSLMAQARDRISGTTGESAAAATGALRLARERAVTQGIDGVSAAMASQGLRSGASGYDAAVNGLAKTRAQILAQTMGSPELEGRDYARSANQSDLTNTLNAYGLLAARASQPDAAPYNIPNINGTSASALAQSRAAASAGLGTAGGLTGSAAAGMRAAPLPAMDSTYDLFGGLSALLNSPNFGSQIGQIFGNRNADKTPTKAY